MSWGLLKIQKLGGGRPGGGVCGGGTDDGLLRRWEGGREGRREGRGGRGKKSTALISLKPSEGNALHKPKKLQTFEGIRSLKRVR